MPILLHCPDCAAKIRAPDQIVGRQVRCPKCDAEFIAAVEETFEPDVEQVPAPPSPPPAPPEVKETTSNDAVPTPPPEEKPEEVAVAPPKPVYEQEYSPPNPVADILLFRTMIAPIIIQGCFWVAVILCVLTGVV